MKYVEALAIVVIILNYSSLNCEEGDKKESTCVVTLVLFLVLPTLVRVEVKTDI